MNPGAGAWVLAVLVVASGLAGCTRPAGPGPGPDGDADGSAPPALRFSGDSALSFAEDQLRWPNGSVRYRIPGTPGNDAVARMLVTNWTELGWTSSLQFFDGTTFLDEPKHPVIDSAIERHCNATERRRVENLTFGNVRAQIGTGPEIVIGAHFDSKRFATQDPDRPRAPVHGADDGASGVAALWELARVLEGRVRNVTVTLVAFDGEDGWDECHPSAGATHFANRMGPRRVDDVSAVVILDMVGGADARFPKEGHSREHAPDVVNAIWSTAEAQGASRFAGEGGRVGDDHLPFQRRGMPAADVIQVPFPAYWHTREDTLDKLSADTLGEVGRVVEAFVLAADRRGGEIGAAR